MTRSGLPRPAAAGLVAGGVLTAAAAAPPLWEALAARPPRFWALALVLALAIVVAVFARRCPTAVLLVAAAGYAVLRLAPEPTLSAVSFVAVAAGSAAYRSERPRSLVVTTVIAAGVVWAVLAVVSGPPLSAVPPATTAVVVALPALVGRHLRQRLLLAATGWVRAADLQAAQRTAVAAARLRERGRIAAQMHDRLGHELSLVSLQAAALEVDTGLDPAYRRRAAAIRAGVGEAADRLTEIVDVLREPGGPGDPGARTDHVGPDDPDDLDGLVRRAAGAGMRVDARLDPLPDGLRRDAVAALYETLREALTNAAKHAPGAPVTVGLHVAESTGPGAGPTAELTVANGRAPGGAPSRTGADPGRSGSGLVRQRERVRVAGGTLTTRADDGGFSLTVRVGPPADDVGPDEGAAQPDPVVAPAGPGPVRLADVPSDLRLRLRRTLVRTGVPVVAVLVVIVAAAVGTDYAAHRSSTLPADRFAALRPGQPERSVLALLPRQQARPSRREFVHGPRRPEGTDCRYYRADSRPVVDPPVRAYRLCFEAGRLRSADRVAYYPEP